MIEIYTDGSWDYKTKLGGWSYLITEDDKELETDSHYAESTTNNRMELTGALEALKRVNQLELKEDVNIISDSQYLIKTLNSNWNTNSNQDLWLEIKKEILESKSRIGWIWIRGHGNSKFNNRADKIAFAALEKIRKLLTSK